MSGYGKHPIGSKRPIGVSRLRVEVKRRKLSFSAADEEPKQEQKRELEDVPVCAPAIVVTGAEESAPSALLPAEEMLLRALAGSGSEGLDLLAKMYKRSHAKPAAETSLYGLYQKRKAEVVGHVVRRVASLLAGEADAKSSSTLLSIAWQLHPCVVQAAEEEGRDGRVTAANVGPSHCLSILSALSQLAMSLESFEVQETDRILSVCVVRDLQASKTPNEGLTLSAWCVNVALACSTLRLIRTHFSDWDATTNHIAVALMQLILRLEAALRWYESRRDREREVRCLGKALRGAAGLLDDTFKGKRTQRDDVATFRHDLVVQHLLSLLHSADVVHRLAACGVHLLHSLPSFYVQQLQVVTMLSSQDIGAIREVVGSVAATCRRRRARCTTREQLAVTHLYTQVCKLGDNILPAPLMPFIQEFAKTPNLGQELAEELVRALLVTPTCIAADGVYAIVAILKHFPRLDDSVSVFQQICLVLRQQMRQFGQQMLAHICSSSSLLAEFEHLLNDDRLAKDVIQVLEQCVRVNDCCMYNLIESGLACVVLCSKKLMEDNKTFVRLHGAFCIANARTLEWRIATTGTSSTVFSLMCMRMAVGVDDFRQLVFRTSAMDTLETILAEGQGGSKQARKSEARRLSGSFICTPKPYCHSIAALVLQDLANPHLDRQWVDELSCLEQRRPAAVAAFAPLHGDRDNQQVKLRCSSDHTASENIHIDVLKSCSKLVAAAGWEASGEEESRNLDVDCSPTSLPLLTNLLYGVWDSQVGDLTAMLRLCAEWDLPAQAEWTCHRAVAHSLSMASLEEVYGMVKDKDDFLRLACVRAAMKDLPSVLLHDRLASWPTDLKVRLIRDCCAFVRGALA